MTDNLTETRVDFEDESSRGTFVGLGVVLYGFSSVAAGVFDIIWGEFEPYHQPLQALSSAIADIKILVYLGAVMMIAAGIAIMWRRTIRNGAATLSVIYGIFGAATLRRFYTAPHYLGFHVNVFIGVIVSLGQQLILVIAAIIVYRWVAGRNPVSRRMALFFRWAFGLSAVDFGLAHLTGIRVVASMIPKWMPLGGAFWTVLSGIAFILAGVGIVSGLLDVLAARLLSAMLLIFSIIVLAPMMFVSPDSHVSWGVNAYNLTAVASAWIMADWLSSFGQRNISEGEIP